MGPKQIINVHTHIHKTQDIDARVKLWRECNVRKVCVQVASTVDTEHSYGNEGVLEWMKKYPDIILGFGRVDLGWEPDGAKTVQKLKDKGFTGLKFIAPVYPYDDERYFPLYERAEQLGMPILFHTGYLWCEPGQRQLGISQDKMRAIRLDTLGRSFPNLRMMIAHLGNPEYDVALDMIMFFENIWGEYSGHSGSKFRQTVLRKLFHPLPGADMADPEENLAITYFRKLCFATDNPEPPVWIALNERVMGELELPEDLREDFWWRNAARWLGIDEEMV